jgi:hypothetical protein
MDYPPYIAEAARKVQHDAMHDPVLLQLFFWWLRGKGRQSLPIDIVHVRAIVYAGGDLSLVRLGAPFIMMQMFFRLELVFVSFEEAKACNRSIF